MFSHLSPDLKAFWTRFVLGAVLALVCLVVSAPEEDAVPRARKTVAEMPKAAMGAEGFVEVVAADVPGDPVGFRLPVLQFTTRLLREIERVYGLEMPRGDVGLLIHAQDGTTNDVRVISRAGRRGTAAMMHIWLPSPGYSDLEAFRFAIAKGYFRCWIDRNRPKEGGRPAVEMPDWMVLGALRALNPETVHDDKRGVLTMWSEARMPYFPVLCRNLRVGTGENAMLCGYIVSWLRERRLFKKTLEGFAAGETLDAARLATDLTGEKDPDLQDRASDERFAKLTRAVLSPGRASRWDLKVFTSRLLLYPAEFDKNIGANGTSCTFREALALAAENETVRQAAWQKAREMPFCAIGRGDSLAATATAYRKFLIGVARGESPEVLRPLLDNADALMEKTVNENRKDDNR